MCYLWNYVLTEKYEMQVDQVFEKYYSDLAERAEQLISAISSDSFRDILQELHGIEERCRLLLFYLDHPDLWTHSSSEQVIDTIEEEYKQSYLENLMHVDEKIGTSLLTLI
ncbi:hypothetical protein D920_00857 [Enterococcus faecalis 13-SD-W-01]|nr:hypothetical protein D920_00857 [Enterococcus faecalis 13-SD-W-01]